MTRTIMLEAGKRYDMSNMRVAGWISRSCPTGKANPIPGPAGINVYDYFRDGVYLGADEDGVEPVFVTLAAEGGR